MLIDSSLPLALSRFFVPRSSCYVVVNEGRSFVLANCLFVYEARLRWFMIVNDWFARCASVYQKGFCIHEGLGYIESIIICRTMVIVCAFATSV